MNRHVGLLVAGSALLIATGCGGAPGVEARALQPTSLLDGPADATMTVGALRQELLSFADRVMSEMARASAAAMAADSTPAGRAFAQSLQADVAASTVNLAVAPDVETALKDLMVSVAAHRASLVGSGPADFHPTAKTALESSLTTLEAEIWSVGEKVYASDEISGLRARLDRWAKDGGERHAAGLVRAADLPAGPTATMGKGLLTPLSQAVEEIEESRLLGERALFLAERLPMIALWRAEAMTWELMAAPESRQMMGDFTLMSATLDRLATRVDSLPMIMDAQREAFLSAFDEREATVRTLLGDVGSVIQEADGLTESGERMANLTKDAAGSIDTSLSSAERLLASLRDAEAPGGALSLDIEAYTAALTDFRAAAEALDKSLARAEGMADTPRNVIDHAAWRAAQLIVLLFVLLAAYRFVPALISKRSAPGS